MEAVVTIPGEVPATMANEAILDLILSDLIHNSSKYAASFQPSSLRLQPRRSRLCLVFQDRGDEIAPVDIAHMTEPFVRDERVIDTNPGWAWAWHCASGLLRLSGIVCCVAEVYPPQLACSSASWIA